MSLQSKLPGFGISAAKIMACGCPVIASRTGCSREAVGDAGWLVEPYNVKDIADKILHIAQDLELGWKLNEKGLKRAKQLSRKNRTT